MLHWNGTAWARIPSPNPAGRGRGDSLTAVSAVSPSDAWAVGVGAGTTSPPSSSTIALHWNGTRWTQVPIPTPGVESGLSGVSAASASNAWAVGCLCNDGSPAPNHTLILRWNGKSWTRS